MTQTLSWTPTNSNGRGYPEWEAAQAGPDANTQIVPVFFRITQSVTSGALADDTGGLSVTALTAQLVVFGAVLPAEEADRLYTESKALQAQGTNLDSWDWRSITYMTRAQVPGFDITPGFEVLHIGPAIGTGLANTATLSPRDLTPASRLPLSPVQGLIDDGLPFLNARFQAPFGQSRVAAIWLQTDARWTPPMPEPRIGRVLTRTQINSLIASGPESDSYRALNRTLLPVTERASTDFHISHGAHVLDVAAGLDPSQTDSPLKDVPIYAVQLPPASVADTSGRRNEGYVVMGLRWMLHQCLRDAQPRGVHPIVLTLTMGALAGPADGSQFLADWLAHEIRSYDLITGTQLYLSMAYGNARRGRLVARTTAQANQPVTVDWRVLPEDFTPSFAELRVARADHTAPIEVTLTPPTPSLPSLSFQWAPGPQTHAHLLRDPLGHVFAAAYPVAEADSDAILLALSPTARHGSGPTIPAGAWKIVVSGTDAATPVVTLRVQRDETPAGYRILGRQSYLDHPLGWEWDFQTRDWIKPLEPGMRDHSAGTCPVTRRGSPVAHAGLSHPQAAFVGSVKPIAGNPDGRVMSLYSAEGVDPMDPLGQGESPGPSLSAIADDGSNLFGRLGGGVLTSSTVRLSGTSVAAPAVSRALTLAIIAAQNAGTAAPSFADLIQPAPLEPERVMGQGALKGQSPYAPEDSGKAHAALVM